MKKNITSIIILLIFFSVSAHSQEVSSENTVSDSETENTENITENAISDNGSEENNLNDLNNYESKVKNTIKHIKNDMDISFLKKIGDGKGFLFLDGFLETEFKWTLGFELFKDYTLTKIQTPIFLQTANLTLFLLMDNRWYFDVNYRDKLTSVTLAGGYIDTDSEVQKHIRIGNSGIKFPAYYPFIKTGGGTQIAPGIAAQFGNKTWQADTVLRYESSEKNKKIFFGKNEVTKKNISISSWERAKYFFIPTDDLYGKQIEVLVKDFENSRWRLLQNNEYIVDSRQKILILNRSFIYGVAINIGEKADEIITKTKDYFLGSEIYNSIELNSKITVNGKTYIQLKKYNTFSCFEIASIYNSDSLDTKDEITIVNTKDNTINKVFYVKSVSLGLILEKLFFKGFIQIAFQGKNNDYSKPETRFPLMQSDIHIYFTKKINNNLNTEHDNSMEINAYSYTPVSDFILPKETNPADIEVIKNGIPILDFSYNEYTNILSLKDEILPSDKIEVRWSESKTYSDTGVVKTALGIKWLPIQTLDLFLAVSSDIGVNKNIGNINDKYNISSGLNYNYSGLKTGIWSGVEADVERVNYKKPEYVISKNHIYFTYEKNEVLLSSKNETDIFSNPKIDIDADINKNSKNKYFNLRSSASAELDIWKIHLGGKISVRDNLKKNNEIIESYGHTVKMPIYFFTAEELFFVNQNSKILSRTNKLEFNKYIKLLHLTSVNYDKEFCEQKITSIFSPFIPVSDKGVFFIEAGINLNQKYKLVNNIITSGYTNTWKQSLIDSYSGGIENAKIRNEKIHFIFNWFNSGINDYSDGFNFLGFNFDSYIEANNNADSDKIYKNLYLFKFPMVLKNVFITPVWERYTSKILKNIISKNYKEDFNLIFNGIREQYWFFASPFFYDLFDKKILSEIQLSNIHSYIFSNTYGLEISRLIYYDLKDIYTPTEFSVKFARIIKSDNTKELGTDYYKLTFGLNYQTLNISGKNGFLNWFKNYEQDELNRNYKWSFYFNKNIFSFNFNSMHKLFFYLHGENKIGFENIFDITADKYDRKIKASSWSEDFSFLYIFEGAKSIPKFLFSFLTNINVSDEREEKLTVSIFRKYLFDNAGYKISFQHTQKTKIGNNGEIKLFAGIGLASTNRKSALLDLTMGITGKIEY